MLRKLFLSVLCLSFFAQLFAQSPEFIRDFNKELINLEPHHFSDLDSTHFLFKTASKGYPNSIWISDGTAGGTRPFVELDPYYPLYDHARIEFGSSLFLYRSSGAISGPTTLYLLHKDPWKLGQVVSDQGVPFYSCSYPVVRNKKAYFTAKAEGARYYDVWQLNEGDSVAQKIFESDSLNPIKNMTAIWPCKEGLVIPLHSPATGVELHKIDTDLDSILLLKDAIPGPTAGAAGLIDHFQDGKLFWQIGDKNEIWSSDGSDTGTHLFYKDDWKEVEYTFYPRNDSVLYIHVRKLGPEPSHKLLRYTSRQNDLRIEMGPDSPMINWSPRFLPNWKYSGIVEFYANDTAIYLSLFDTAFHSTRLPPIAPTDFYLEIVDAPGKLIAYYKLDGLYDRFMLYENNEWKDISAAFPSSPIYTFAHNQHIYFTLNDGPQDFIYKDSTTSSSFQLAEVSRLLNETKNVNYEWVSLDSGLLILVQEPQDTFTRFYDLSNYRAPKLIHEIKGTHILLELDSHLKFLHPTPFFYNDTSEFIEVSIRSKQLGSKHTIPVGSSSYSRSWKVGDTYFLTFTNKHSNKELWCYTRDSGFKKFIEGDSYVILGKFKDKLYFQQTLSNGEKKVGYTDGTALGTQFVAPLSDKTAKLGLSNFYSTAHLLYFTFSDSATGSEFWISDGTDSGTRLAQDLYPGIGSSSPGEYQRMGDSIYFNASQINGRYLYVCDTLGGSLRILNDTANYPNINFGSLRKMGRFLLFNYMAHPYYNALGSYDTENNSFRFISDSLASQKGVELLSSNDLIRAWEVNNASDTFLYMNASSKAFGQELWRIDGTVEGTKMVKDIFPGLENSYPYFGIERNDYLYFAAIDPQHGGEIWRIHTECLKAEISYESICQNEITTFQSVIDPYSEEDIAVHWMINGDTLFGDSVSYLIPNQEYQTIELRAGNAVCQVSEKKDIYSGARTFSTVQKNADTLCMAGHTFNFVALDNNPNKEFTWYWGDGDSSTEKNTNHSYPAPGTYSLKMHASDKGSCEDSQSFTLQVNATPPTPIIMGPSYSEQAKDTFYTNKQAGSTYLWSSDAGTLNQIITDTAVSFLWTYPTGYVTVFLYERNQFQCSSVQSSHLVQRKQIQSLALEMDEVTIYPNPFNSVVQITSISGQITSIEVVDIQGKVVFRNRDILPSHETGIDLSELKPGSYFLYGVANGQSFQRLLVKE